MKNIFTFLLLLFSLLSCSSLDKKVSELNYKNDIQQIRENGKLTNEEALGLTNYIKFLLRTTFPTKIGINKTYRQLVKEMKANEKIINNRFKTSK